jgi:hypothetical protein
MVDTHRRLAVAQHETSANGHDRVGCACYSRRSINPAQTLDSTLWSPVTCHRFGIRRPVAAVVVKRACGIPPDAFRSIRLKLPAHITFKFSSRRTTVTIICLALTLFLTAQARPLFGQGFEVTNRTAPSVIGAGSFVSLEGRFSIGLPQTNHSFTTVSIEILGGRATGDSYSWRMKEGTFSTSFADAPQSLNEPDTGKVLLAKVRNETVAFANSKNGILSERTIELDKHAGTEFRIEFRSGVLIQRLFLVSRRLYQVSLVVKSEQHIYESVAVSILDSFRVLNDAEVAVAAKAEEAKAQPSPLPQEPVVKRDGTDASDGGLHGKVKTVLRESEDLSGTWAVGTRKPTSMEYYNEGGNLTKSESYDWKGNLFQILVYGYLDGARVSDRKTITHEYNPPPIMISSEAGEAKPNYDPRYSNKFAFKYDDKKRLIEKTWFNNDGKLSLRYVYKYSELQREELVYTADGSLNQRYVSLLDNQGNEIEETSYEVGGETVRSKQAYAYEFDVNGNWTKQTTSKWVTKDGRSYYEPANVYYRTITYY